jgi:ribosomal protein S14
MGYSLKNQNQKDRKKRDYIAIFNIKQLPYRFYLMNKNCILKPSILLHNQIFPLSTKTKIKNRCVLAFTSKGTKKPLTLNRNILKTLIHKGFIPFTKI